MPERNYEMECRVGWLSAVVKDLCDIEDKLSRYELVALLRATANVLLAVDAANDRLHNVENDQLALENAAVIRHVWYKVMSESSDEKNESLRPAQANILNVLKSCAPDGSAWVHKDELRKDPRFPAGGTKDEAMAELRRLGYVEADNLGNWRLTFKGLKWEDDS